MAGLGTMARTFANPPREFGFIVFWFWNDDLTDSEIVRQIREFHAKGFGGFIPHARVGLSRRVGYLTPEWFRLLKVAVEEAARLGLKVVLYDEGSYPSGSAQGRVVQENPDWAAKCLFAVHQTVSGPAKGFWRPNPSRALGYRLVAVVAGRETGKDALDPATLRCLTWNEHEVVRYEVPDGIWRLVACWEGHSGGHIRGVFEEEEDGHALAPPAADILREDSVASFIRHTHDQYYEHLKEHFGTTIIAMFTDEPSPMGRLSGRAIPAPKPWTPGFLADVQPLWDEDVAKWLPALWLDYGPRTDAFRWTWRHAVQKRLERTFYRQNSEWCAAHGIALTGHAAHSNEMAALRHFQWPGQDLVWRMVTPGAASALEGPDSLAAKAASSAARLGQRRFNVTEVFGAYGWRLSFDEMKWLLDWHLVRGTNLILPHACFYSIRGRRAFESEPDIGVHNVWWPHFGLLADYARRLCWLFSDGEEVCEVGILSDGDALSWRAAKALHQRQVGFIFLDQTGLCSATVADGRLLAGGQRLKVLIVDAPGLLSPEAQERLEEFAAAGGPILRQWTPETLAAQVTAHVGQDIGWHGDGAQDVRAMHYRKQGRDFYLLVNEGEMTVSGNVVLACRGAVELWDALDGRARPWPAQVIDAGMSVPIRLDRREVVVLVIDSSKEPCPEHPLPSVPGAVVSDIVGHWNVSDATGTPVDVPCPGNWARTPGWETFTGTLCFWAEFELDHARAAEAAFLDLGNVGDIAEVKLNGTTLGVRGWSPYVFELGQVCIAGLNRIEVRVTNSMANAYDGIQMPSGLLCPVVLRKVGHLARD